MASVATYYLTDSNGIISCGDIGVSVEDWSALLSSEKAAPYIDTLIRFLREQDHQASCTQLSLKYGYPSTYFNAKVIQFSKWVRNTLDRFRIMRDDSTEYFWGVTMQKGWKSENGFVWQLRNELVTALRLYLMDDLINKFETSRQSSLEKELHKWDLLDQTQEAYTVYKDEIYRLICAFFGLEPRKTGLKLSHFTEVINSIADSFGDTIEQLMLPAIANYPVKPTILAVQTLFWLMKDYMRDSMEKDTKNYWLAGYTFGKNDSQLERFTNEGIWESIHNDDNKSDQALLSLVKTINVGDVIILKSSSTKGKNHDIPFLRVKAVGIVTAPCVMTETDGVTKCCFPVNYVNKDVTDFEGKAFGSYRKALHKADLRIANLIEYVNRIIHPANSNMSIYQDYIDLLKATHNLVLCGAPGTGKTHLAHAIAMEMGAVCEFVQFHPSYDYSDFVEGLRPVERADGQMGFQRMDGVFKRFCREAIKNISDSEKSLDSLQAELSWQEKLHVFINDAAEKGKSFKLVNGGTFTILDMEMNVIRIHNQQNEKTTHITVNADEILELLSKNVNLTAVKDIRNYFNRKFGTQPDSYTFVITNEIRKMKQSDPGVVASKIDRKDFVFIIDEINRGEAGKIFGELFYAIDPGYRGKREHMVQTQYQNLVAETDVFGKGFYIPDNVYIIATMNDIDRSVESMDFAMRRRFTWKEVTPTDTESMLDTLSYADKAKETMHRLNTAIAETDGLGAAYMIGPAYFLKLKDNGGDFKKLWQMNIEPLLKEYLRGFRRVPEIMDKFRVAYFAPGKSPATTDLIDED